MILILGLSARIESTLRGRSLQGYEVARLQERCSGRHRQTHNVLEVSFPLTAVVEERGFQTLRLHILRNRRFETS